MRGRIHRPWLRPITRTGLKDESETILSSVGEITHRCWRSHAGVSHGANGDFRCREGALEGDIRIVRCVAAPCVPAAAECTDVHALAIRGERRAARGREAEIVLRSRNEVARYHVAAGGGAK